MIPILVGQFHGVIFDAVKNDLTNVVLISTDVTFEVDLFFKANHIDILNLSGIDEDLFQAGCFEVVGKWI